MASTKNITNIYESYLEMSFINQGNFNAKITPSSIVGSFIPCYNIKEFYIDSLIYLHLHASLYYELYALINNNNNNISYFKNAVDKLKIQIINAQNTNNTTNNTNIGQIYIDPPSVTNNNNEVNSCIFKFSLANFYSKYNNREGYKSYADNSESDSTQYKKFEAIKPILDNISLLPSDLTITIAGLYKTGDTIHTYKTTRVESGELTDYNVNSNNYITESYSSTYDIASRLHMLKKIIKDILSQGHDKIMSYLLYYTIFYHLVVYNTSIQNEININYLHNIKDFNKLVSGSKISSLKQAIEGISYNTGTSIDFATGDYSDNSRNIKTLLNNLKNNIATLQSSYLGTGSAEYIDSKSKYASKIGVLNDIKADFDRIQTELNITIKDYNKYIKNFQNVKIYANFIIMVLIIVIIITILVTLLDSITPNFKSYYYVIAFCILSFITFIYYNKFRYINLYENFTNQIYNSVKYDTTSTITSGTLIEKNNAACIANTINITDQTNGDNIIKKKNSHINFINSLIIPLNGYIESIANIMNGLRTNIYTANYGVFTKDGNNYLYNLYLDKKSQNEANRIKKVALANMLDTMKRHIVYLFNIILLISLLTIILLLGLILFSNFPFYLNYIIILCIILIVIIIIYFINSIVQPTRMIVNKNYWANNNPSKILMSKIV